MKSVCALLLMLSLNGYGQSELQLGTISTDTVKIIMLCCDTSMVNGKCYWAYGHSVVINQVEHTYQSHNTTVDKDGNIVSPIIQQHLYYLDKNKKKLNNNIVVWQSIELNNRFLKASDWQTWNKQPINK